jgi:hypothetical protein
MSDTKRWLLTIIYRAESGPCVVDYDIEELDEIADIVERGPDWNAIMSIDCELQSPDESVVLQSPIQKEKP